MTIYQKDRLFDQLVSRDFHLLDQHFQRKLDLRINEFAVQLHLGIIKFTISNILTETRYGILHFIYDFNIIWDSEKKSEHYF